jgi:DNA-binding NarL/FixJ family response regulator
MHSSQATVTPWPAQIRVVVADDRTLFREALVCLLSSKGTLQVMATGPTADAASLVAAHQPDVLVLGATDGAVAAARAVAPPPGVKMVVIGDRDEAPARVLAAGASGFVACGAAPDDLIAAITAVHAGERFPADAGDADDPVGILSPRELETLKFLAVGDTNREIALRLGISVKTVDTHRGHVLKKLRLRNNSDLTRFAIQHGLIDRGA